METQRLARAGESILSSGRAFCAQSRRVSREDNNNFRLSAAKAKRGDAALRNAAKQCRLRVALSGPAIVAVGGVVVVAGCRLPVAGRRLRVASRRAAGRRRKKDARRR